MSFRVRITIVFVFIAAFLITAPVVVLYTAGYRYNFTTKSIVQTGLFYVTSIPKGAKIFLNGDDKGETPDFVKHIIPGEYQLKLVKDGYHTWEKKLPVKSKETTFVEDVVLFLESAPKNLIFSDIEISAIDPTKTMIAFVSHSPSWLEVWIYHTVQKKQTLLFRVTDSGSTTIDLTWSADGERILISQNTGNTDNTYTLIDKSGRNIFELNSLTKDTITNAWWHPTDAHAIIFNTRKATFVYRLTSQTVSELYPEPVLATLMEGKAVIIEQAEDQTSIFRYFNEKAEIIAYLPEGNYQLLPAPEPYLLLKETERGKLILIDTSSGDQPILLNEDGVGAEWALDDTGRLLYFSNFEIHVYNPWTHYSELLTRVGGGITGAAWHPEGNAVLVSKSDKIEAIELDPRDQRNIIELASGKNISNVWISKNGQKAYFVGAVDPDRGLFELEILEK